MHAPFDTPMMSSTSDLALPLVRSLARFCLRCLADNAAFGAFDAYFWRKTGYLEHKSIAEELSSRPRG